MYSPDQHHIDPSNPANWREPKFRYDIRDRKGRELDSFNDADFAKAAVFNSEIYMGGELSVFEVDEEYGDEECILSAEWDDDVQRYLEA